MSVDTMFGLLLDRLCTHESAVLAFSGGLDSSFLLRALADSGIRYLAVTGVSETTPAHDLEDAGRLAQELGAPHRVISTHEMQNERFLMNPPDRCFHCKDGLFGQLKEIAGSEGYDVVLDGSNLSDLSDHRPGLVAAKKHGVLSPLMECGFTKDDVRQAARELGMGVWDKPSSPCLSSRFPYGTRITPEGLDRVRRAEEHLRGLGMRELRVRDHWPVARIEVPESEMAAVMAMRAELSRALNGLGYEFVCLDLDGLRSGSLNRMIK